MTSLALKASLSLWSPTRSFDLISCVHGLHYLGDKLGLICRASSWLTDDGLLVANLDLTNVRFADRSPGRRVSNELRRVGLEYDRRKRLVVCGRRRAITLPYRYLGADDQAGLNYTGQAAVESYYAMVEALDDHNVGLKFV